jgi:outer membrane protein OmpA-like peptidoglycan-associated protein
MKTIVNIILLILALNGFTQTELKSFYFHKNQKVPTPYSQEQLSKFSSKVATGTIIILEINAFTDSLGAVSFNDTLSQIRLNYISKRLPVNQNVKLNSYGLQRPYRVDNVLNWRRVDVIYLIASDIPESADFTNDINIQEAQNDKKEDLSLLNEKLETTTNDKTDVFSKSMADMKPLVLDISFKEGTSKILESSYMEITRLVIYLKENPSVKAEIRGHVCCGNNMHISQSRAKSVYKRLIKQGISKNRLSFKGMSNKEPLVFPETTNADRQKNRRVDVNLYN